MLNLMLMIFGWTVGALLAMTVVLHTIPKLGAPGRALAAWLCRAPGLDLVVTYFTIGPIISGAIIGGSAGVGVSVVAQIVAVMIWTALHELCHLNAAKGPRIKKFLNGRVGTVRNYVGVWWTAWAVPIFWIIRVAEYLVYPPVGVLVRLPQYKASEWVNVSRQKFSGLVGHDLIWCLYCDWMTGVWSLGSEMLRNIESFWCPIRFHSEKKCANCKTDFPDIDGGWVHHSGTMADVVSTMEEMYPAGAKVMPWFGHPVRLTIEGKDQPKS